MIEHNHNEKEKDTDKLSGVETTGHEWDGIKELNNPLPRWWLWVFYISIIWAIGYWFIYPAWPTLTGEGERGGTKGSLEWSQYKQLDEQRKEIVDRRAAYLDRFHNASFAEILNDPELYAFAQAGGQAAFKDNCATCHGIGGAGAKGYPNLNDDDWIWGGKLDDIYQTIKYGIRMHEEARDSAMPAFADMLSDKEITEVAAYVQGLHDGSSMVPPNATATEADFAALSQGGQLFQKNCASCHNHDGKGNREFGAPNLADAIWLESDDGSIEAITRQVKNPKHGKMPAWINRLDENTIRQLTIYVHELGGGE